MQVLNLRWNAYRTPSQLADVVAALAAEFGLTVGPVSELKSIPGSQHWHLKKDGHRGVLEVTLAARDQTGNVSVHDNRVGSWTPEALTAFRDRLQALLA